MLANRVINLKASPTIALNALVNKMKSDGRKIVNLSIGEPDFSTPENIKEAAIKAIRDNFSHYTPTAGILPLREAICNKLKIDNNLNYSPEEVIVGSGSKQLLYNAFQVLCDPGYEVLLAAPTWATYVEQIELTGAIPVFIPLQTPFKLTAEDVKRHITDKTKVLLLNSPSNPTGSAIEADELRKIADIAVENNIYVVSDEIYEKIIYAKKFLSIASFGEEIKQHTLTINGFSKAYAMTGWRLGYAAGPVEIIRAMSNMQDQQTSNPSSIAQMAAIEALNGSQDAITMMVNEFQKRRDVMVSSLLSNNMLELSVPEGAFYLFVSVQKLLGKNYQTSSQWCKAFLEEESVAVTPGEAFYAPGYFRLSYAASMEDLKKASEKILEFTMRN